MSRKISITVMVGLALFTSTAVFAQKIAKELEDAINAASNFADWKPEDSMYPKEDGKLALENGKSLPRDNRRRRVEGPG